MFFEHYMWWFRQVVPELVEGLNQHRLRGTSADIELCRNGSAPEDYLRCLFEKTPYAKTREDREKLLPWNIEFTPYKIRGEWI